MSVTEEEAKTKWCPEARASNNGEQPVTINRSYNAPDPDCLCIGSACMAWRWKLQTRFDEEREGKLGYCGKAGKP